ncbi:unnamed protein product [Sphagnum balticum]
MPNKQKRSLQNILEWIGKYAELLEGFDEEFTLPFYDELAKMEDRIEDIHNDVEQASEESEEEDEEE